MEVAEKFVDNAFQRGYFEDESAVSNNSYLSDEEWVEMMSKRFVNVHNVNRSELISWDETLRNIEKRRRYARRQQY